MYKFSFFTHSLKISTVLKYTEPHNLTVGTISMMAHITRSTFQNEITENTILFPSTIPCPCVVREHQCDKVTSGIFITCLYIALFTIKLFVH